MSKFYVISGNLRVVCNAADPGEAIQKALNKCTSRTLLGRVICVNEQGFEGLHETDLYFHTSFILDELGIGYTA